MGQAVPCHRCKTVTHLEWKTYSEHAWWVTCIGCGNTGPAEPSQSDAGEAWNKQESKWQEKPTPAPEPPEERSRIIDLTNC